MKDQIVGYSSLNMHGYPLDTIWCDGAPGAMTPDEARQYAWGIVDDDEAIGVLVLRATTDTRPVDGAV